MKIDHVSIGWSDLGVLQNLFADSGMATEYGGPHSSGNTHMSLLGFGDGSYIELISTVRPDAVSSSWRRQIEEDGGPCAWCVEQTDIAHEVEEAKRLGISATGPIAYTRKRPDGVLVEWDLGFLGDGEAGSTLPFMIKDKTPRDFRVRPSASVSGAGSPLKGVGGVVLAVHDLDSSTAQFRKLYGWEEPETDVGLLEGATLARFEGTPVTLAAPRGQGWLSQRLAGFGPSPCAFLLDAVDLDSASRSHPLTPRQPWFGGHKLSWVKPMKDRGIMLGVVGA
ncbi:MAG: VOC family protein [Thaumarchaeota archaeon]|nr:VOC family protein [Nitrososphaerota archaeon]